MLYSGWAIAPIFSSLFALSVRAFFWSAYERPDDYDRPLRFRA